jgi:glucose-1-phosphatase
VKYIDKALVTDQAKAPKITLLVGHDSNIASLLTALDFKPYQPTISTSARQLAAK